MRKKNKTLSSRAERDFYDICYTWYKRRHRLFARQIAAILHMTPEQVLRTKKNAINKLKIILENRYPVTSTSNQDKIFYEIMAHAADNKSCSYTFGREDR